MDDLEKEHRERDEAKRKRDSAAFLVSRNAPPPPFSWRMHSQAMLEESEFVTADTQFRDLQKERKDALRTPSSLMRARAGSISHDPRFEALASVERLKIFDQVEYLRRACTE